MDVNDASSRILAGLLEARTGQQLTMSRRWRIETALRSLMREREIHSLDQLVATLVAGREPALADAVVEALLNNETYFFREMRSMGSAPYSPRMEKARARERKLRIWCAGCSTGQEAYSLAISFAEQKLRWHGWTIDIVGTDISRSAIDQARGGVYSQFEVQRGLPVMQMMRWFEEAPGQSWRIAGDLQRAVRFQVHSLVEKPRSERLRHHPGRTVLIYFIDRMRRTPSPGGRGKRRRRRVRPPARR